MAKLHKINDIVLEVLKKYPETRGDDFLEYHANETGDNGDTNLMVYREWYLTREEAERALVERKEQ